MKRFQHPKRWSSRLEHFVALPALFIEYFVDFLLASWQEIKSAFKFSVDNKKP